MHCDRNLTLSSKRCLIGKGRIGGCVIWYHSSSLVAKVESPRILVFSNSQILEFSHRHNLQCLLLRGHHRFTMLLSPFLVLVLVSVRSVRLEFLGKNHRLAQISILVLGTRLFVTLWRLGPRSYLGQSHI